MQQVLFLSVTSSVETRQLVTKSKIMSQLFTWLVTSSTNPDQMSATVRGVLVLLVPFIAHFVGLDEASSNGLVDGIVAFINTSLALIGVGITLFGILRKVRLGRWAHPDTITP